MKLIHLGLSLELTADRSLLRQDAATPARGGSWIGGEDGLGVPSVGDYSGLLRAGRGARPVRLGWLAQGWAGSLWEGWLWGQSLV